MKVKIVFTSLLSMTLLQAVDTNAAEMSPKQEGITYIKMLGGALKTELQAHMKKDSSGLEALAFCTGNAERMTDEINAKLPAYAKVRRTSLQTSRNVPETRRHHLHQDAWRCAKNRTSSPYEKGFLRF